MGTNDQKSAATGSSDAEGGKPIKESPRDGMKDAVGGSAAEKQAGADAEHPGEIPPKGWWHVLKRVGAGFLQDRVMTEAAGVTFYALLALFPAITTVISLYGLFGNAAALSNQVEDLAGFLPGGGIEVIKGQIDSVTSHGHQALGLGAVIGLLASLWSANAGMKALFDALNVIYHEHETRSFVRLTLITLGFTLGGIVFILVALGAVVVLPIVLNFIGLTTLGAILIKWGRWPVMLVIFSLALALVYRFGPSRNRARWQWVSWGGTGAALLWLLVSAAFSFYVENFGSYDKTYGTLGAAIGFMTWIWISSMVVLLGAELNAELEQQTERDSTEGGEKPQGQRGAFKADVKS